VNKRINLLLAHPDDEVIFGWAVLKGAKRIICCSNDLNNPERAWCKDRNKALLEIGNLVGAEVVCLDNNSEFYRLPTRNGDLNSFVNNVMNVVNMIVGDYHDNLIFTHNSWGEYGHLDHILVNQIAHLTKYDLITSDITLDAGWFEVDNNLIGRKNFISNHTIDLDFYNRCKKIYDKYGCWTWSKEPVKECNLYEI